MPEAVRDRPTTSHEYIFLLSKRKTYYYDADAIREPVTGNAHTRGDGLNPKSVPHASGAGRVKANDSWHAATSKHTMVAGETRNARSVWTLSPEPYREAHFAVFPPELPKRCILAGSRPGDTVLDPFLGSGTTAYMAQSLGRHWVATELNKEYLPLIRRRTRGSNGQIGLLL